ncbi:unnamed protein product [Phytophthora fragariaefolia]|uniref:Unnamed protein product n=1 Tax=Phytophthora fragariaefolia TaxID=1490495 RepID=A0A9W6U369_9STRA|nr:unnamed protein product [Phytophthora fragariaefolia]
MQLTQQPEASSTVESIDGLTYSTPLRTAILSSAILSAVHGVRPSASLYSIGQGCEPDRYSMRRQRHGRAAAVALLLCVVRCASAQPLVGVAGGTEFRIAAAFESVPDENVTEILDEVVVPASLESERVVPTPPTEDFEPRDLRPVVDSSEEHHHRHYSSSLPVPYGGAMVAVEATALLVGGATIIVLLIAKVKARSAVIQYECDEGALTAFSDYRLIEGRR